MGPQAGILSNAPGAVKSMLLLGVLPKSVGIKLASGAMFVVQKQIIPLMPVPPHLQMLLAIRST